MSYDLTGHTRSLSGPPAYEEVLLPYPKSLGEEPFMCKDICIVRLLLTSHPLVRGLLGGVLRVYFVWGLDTLSSDDRPDKTLSSRHLGSGTYSGVY